LALLLVLTSLEAGCTRTVTRRPAYTYEARLVQPDAATPAAGETVFARDVSEAELREREVDETRFRTTGDDGRFAGTFGMRTIVREWLFGAIPTRRPTPAPPINVVYVYILRDFGEWLEVPVLVREQHVVRDAVRHLELGDVRVPEIISTTTVPAAPPERVRRDGGDGDAAAPPITPPRSAGFRRDGS
jgi:hypothetical protein